MVVIEAGSWRGHVARRVVVDVVGGRGRHRERVRVVQLVGQRLWRWHVVWVVEQRTAQRTAGL